MPREHEVLLIRGNELNALNGVKWNGVFAGGNLDKQSQTSQLELSQFDAMPFIQRQDDRKRVPLSVHELLQLGKILLEIASGEMFR